MQSDQATVRCAETLHRGLVPDGITHSAVFIAGEEVRQPDKTLELLGELQQKGLGSVVIWYIAAIICDKAKQPPEELSSLQGCS